MKRRLRWLIPIVVLAVVAVYVVTAWRPRRLLLTLLPVVAVFTAWDVYAISRHHWSYDRGQITGVLLPGDGGYLAT